MKLFVYLIAWFIVLKTLIPRWFKEIRWKISNKITEYKINKYSREDPLKKRIKEVEETICYIERREEEKKHKYEHHYSGTTTVW